MLDGNHRMKGLVGQVLVKQFITRESEKTPTQRLCFIGRYSLTDGTILLLGAVWGVPMASVLRIHVMLCSHYGRDAPIFHDTREREHKMRSDFVQTTTNRGLNELVPLLALGFEYVVKGRRVASVTGT
ncbi:unnamed protein product [Ixodes pacificus]